MTLRPSHSFVDDGGVTVARATAAFPPCGHGNARACAGSGERRAAAEWRTVVTRHRVVSSLHSPRRPGRVRRARATTKKLSSLRKARFVTRAKRTRWFTARKHQYILRIRSSCLRRLYCDFRENVTCLRRNCDREFPETFLYASTYHYIHDVRVIQIEDKQYYFSIFPWTKKRNIKRIEKRFI